MAITFKKIVRECVRPIKRLRQKEEYGFILKRKEQPTFNEDWLITDHNPSFLKDPAFMAAYQRGVEATGEDYRFRWRVHVALWAAAQASKLEGDFVECGVNKGFLSSAIMRYLDWNALNKAFFLFDTFEGLEPTLVTDEEKRLGRLDHKYSNAYAEVKKNFSEFKNVTLIKGAVPYSLKETSIEKVAYLSIDMNCVAPEIAAMKHFWPRIVQGGVIVLDDYAYKGMEPQNAAFNALSKEIGFNILSLPTGQGVIVKH